MRIHTVVINPLFVSCTCTVHVHCVVNKLLKLGINLENTAIVTSHPMPIIVLVLWSITMMLLVAVTMIDAGWR